jgi:hypothetical protein
VCYAHVLGDVSVGQVNIWEHLFGTFIDTPPQDAHLRRIAKTGGFPSYWEKLSSFVTESYKMLPSLAFCVLIAYCFNYLRLSQKKSPATSLIFVSDLRRCAVQSPLSGMLISRPSNLS